jgi:hypothetical protein
MHTLKIGQAQTGDEAYWLSRIDDLLVVRE